MPSSDCATGQSFAAGGTSIEQSAVISKIDVSTTLTTVYRKADIVERVAQSTWTTANRTQRFNVTPVPESPPIEGDEKSGLFVAGILLTLVAIGIIVFTSTAWYFRDKRNSNQFPNNLLASYRKPRRNRTAAASTTITTTPRSTNTGSRSDIQRQPASHGTQQHKSARPRFPTPIHNRFATITLRQHPHGIRFAEQHQPPSLTSLPTKEQLEELRVPFDDEMIRKRFTRAFNMASDHCLEPEFYLTATEDATNIEMVKSLRAQLSQRSNAWTQRQRTTYQQAFPNIHAFLDDLGSLSSLIQGIIAREIWGWADSFTVELLREFRILLAHEDNGNEVVDRDELLRLLDTSRADSSEFERFRMRREVEQRSTTERIFHLTTPFSAAGISSEQSQTRLQSLARIVNAVLDIRILFEVQGSAWPFRPVYLDPQQTEEGEPFDEGLMEVAFYTSGGRSDRVEGMCWPGLAKGDIDTSQGLSDEGVLFHKISVIVTKNDN
ncbi:hypothetical protein BJ508DRAFT_335470 [Ascobolus immersus RN42]|uniref:Uncharacterized protein n=1 Tax=Ascobolus immersus RN42 TaxID=1160509 RepID=A0A3N4HJ77_ASCIM|nr:hypothetical protein BJ508DRAFT_335470 [Ascobolus immersus RN42]